MHKQMKKVSLVVSVLLSAIMMQNVAPAQAAETAREETAPVCLASPTGRTASGDESRSASGALVSEETTAASTGYCTVDCSPCTLKTQECARRGAGSCSPVQACRGTSAQ